MIFVVDLYVILLTMFQVMPFTVKFATLFRQQKVRAIINRSRISVQLSGKHDRKLTTGGVGKSSEHFKVGRSTTFGNKLRIKVCIGPYPVIGRLALSEAYFCIRSQKEVR